MNNTLLNKRQLKFLKRIKKENNKLLDICNYLIMDLNYNNNKKYKDNDLNKFNYNNKGEIINYTFMNDIRLLTENAYNFYHNRIFKPFSFQYKSLEKENRYLKDIINFYKVYCNNKKLLKLISDLNIDNSITNINMFYYQV